MNDNPEACHIEKSNYKSTKEEDSFLLSRHEPLGRHPSKEEIESDYLPLRTSQENHLCEFEERT